MSTLDDSLLVELIDLVYSAAVDNSRWSLVSEALGAAFDARYSLVFGFDPSTTSVLYGNSWGLSTDVLARYETTYAALDIRMPAALDMAPGTVVTDEGLIDRQVYRDSPIYNEFLHPLGCERLLAVLPHNSDNTRVIVSINRSEREGAFDGRDREFLGRLVPHLQRALLMSAKLSRGAVFERLSEEVMARVHFGIALLGRDGALMHANPVLERMLRQRDAVLQVDGRLVVADKTANSQLQKAIARSEMIASSLLCDAPQTIILPGIAGQPCLCLLIAPLSAESIISGVDVPSTVVFLFSETDRPKVDSAALSFVYEISPAEAKVAGKLAEGMNLSEIALLFGLSIETVRTHVKRSLAKMNCESQTELVRKILLGPALTLSQRAASGR